jgi:hypothetical protein
MSVTQILATLPFLSSYDRNIIAASIVSLRGLRQDGPNKKGTSTSKPNKIKGPAQRVSEHRNEPLWKAMKEAQKKFRAYLKENSKTYRDFVDVVDPPLEVKAFREARTAWFLRKEQLAAQREGHKGGNNQNEEAQDP